MSFIVGWLVNFFTEFYHSLFTLGGFLSWFGCVFLLYGLKLIGDKQKFGFYMGVVAEVLWIVWGILNHNAHALIVMSLAIIVMYVRAIRQWGKDEKKVNVEPVQIASKDPDILF